VLEGKGTTVIDGERFDWQPFDTVAIPGGTWFQHENASASEDAILLVASDEPMLAAFGYNRRKGRTDDGEIITLD
jgi:gentisate 1,2-dioxygenase